MITGELHFLHSFNWDQLCLTAEFDLLADKAIYPSSQAAQKSFLFSWPRKPFLCQIPIAHTKRIVDSNLQLLNGAIRK